MTLSIFLYYLNSIAEGAPAVFYSEIGLLSLRKGGYEFTMGFFPLRVVHGYLNISLDLK